MERLTHLEDVESAFAEEPHPAFDGAEVPGGGIGEVGAEAGPRARAPPIDVRQVTGGDQGMQRLHDERALLAEQGRSAMDEVVDGILTKQREVGGRDIDFDAELAIRERLVRRHVELATAGAGGPLDEVGHHIDANGADALRGERAHEPSLATADVEHDVRRAPNHGIDDRLIGDERAALDLALAHGARPRPRVLAPRFDDLRVGERVDRHQDRGWNPAGGSGSCVPRPSTAAAAIWPVTLSVVLNMSGTASTAMRMASPSTGRPSAAYSGAWMNSPPLGIPGALAVSTTAANAIVATCGSPNSIPYSRAMN